MAIQDNLDFFYQKIKNTTTKLLAVSKTHSPELILEAYQTGCKVFAENRVQELVQKYETLPKDIEWHLIGTLQSNKVKYIAEFVHLIHSIDKFSLLEEVNKQAKKCNRVIDCLLQIHIAEEETKFGFDFEEAYQLLQDSKFEALENICIKGVMGMATFTDNTTQIRNEFRSLKDFFEKIKNQIDKKNVVMKEISMGMSSDYEIAIEEGSTYIRVGSAIFGKR
ncbi:MAG: YggS family pyridoxal phosphate-dependent enzyme [Cytophagia bacterium]|nr:MAG: YggS family pyridoxal phosphate-dependent enzyme [Cytophagia bacterium]TAG45796.1 MAG: YggS family pyridoxal phosphate-dependent enzyme [Cytophagia bacterium]TAH28580.1 MAG: YggS family pyridoxal phosphate-dependent enzyme [Cytophagales bacterium]